MSYNMTDELARFYFIKYLVGVAVASPVFVLATEVWNRTQKAEHGSGIQDRIFVIWFRFFCPLNFHSIIQHLSCMQIQCSQKMTYSTFEEINCPWKSNLRIHTDPVLFMELSFRYTLFCITFGNYWIAVNVYIFFQSLVGFGWPLTVFRLCS